MGVALTFGGKAIQNKRGECAWTTGSKKSPVLKRR
jgi:hypothetical protein